MDNTRKLIVGYDLCEDYTQISCYSYKTYEPILIHPIDDEKTPSFPLFYVKRVRQGLGFLAKRLWIVPRMAPEFG